MIWLPIGIVLAGFIPMLIVWIRQYLNKKFIEKAEATTGTVEHVEIRRGHKGNKYIVVTIAYKTYLGEKMKGYHTLFYSKRNMLTVGQQLTVLYDPLKVQKFVLKEYPFNFKAAWILTGILPVIYIVIAYFLWKELKL